MTRSREFTGGPGTSLPEHSAAGEGPPHIRAHRLVGGGRTMHAATAAAAAAACAFPVCRGFTAVGASAEKISSPTSKQRSHFILSSSFLGSSAHLFPRNKGCQQKKHHHRLRRKTPSRLIKARALRFLTNPDDFQVGRFLGSYGFINVTSYSSFQSGGPQAFGNYLSQDVDSLRVQDVGEGKVKIRLYEGKIVKGPFQGTAILFKVYPGQIAGGVEADMMAANELSTHASLQEDSERVCQNIQTLLGAFETKTGEQWLAFQYAGKYSAADYAKFASERVSKDIGKISWYPYEREQTIIFRRYFVVNMLNGIMRGLAFLHDHDKLHQSLGPASVILNTTSEREARYLVPCLRDLAFSVDIRYSSLEASPSPLSEGLWRRANAAGAFNPLQKRAFGIADDIYEAGLLLAYMAFIPFCEAGITDGLSLHRLLESTFKLDIEAAREYCVADESLLEAVKFLDLGDGAGWQLLQAMLNPDYRQRPIAEAVLNHRFMTGAVL